MPELTGEQKAKLRRAVLEYLNKRPGLPFRASVIAGFIAGDWPLQDVADACAFLVSGGLLSAVTDPLGGPVGYQITANGTIYLEHND